MINEETHNQDAGTAAPGDVEAQVAEVPAPSNPAPEASAQQAETPAPAESGSAKPKPDAKRAQEQVEDIKNTTLALVNNAGGAGGLLVLFSLILVIQASVDMKKNRFFAFESYGALAISLGVINLFFGIAILVINKREMLDDKIKQIVIAVMWIFTTICVGVITFKLPYPFFGNGFFSSWGMFFALTFMLKAACTEQVDKAQETFSALGFYAGPLLLISILEFCAAIPFCETPFCGGSIGFAVSVGVVSAFFCIIFVIVNKSSQLPSNVRLMISGFLTVWWLFGVLVTTIDAPFSGIIFVGVGYFLVYAGLFVSLLMFHHEISD